MLRLSPLAYGVDLEYAEHLDPLEGEAAGHDQADVAGAEDDHPPPRQQPHHVDELLRQPRGEHARGPLAGNPDGPASILARAHGQHHRAGINGADALATRHQLQPPDGTDVVDVGVGQHVDAVVDHLLEVTLGVFRPGQFLTEMVQTEAVVDALPEDAAGLALAVDQQDLLGAALARAEGGGHAAGPPPEMTTS